MFAVLALVLALRLVHLSSALQSPLSYQPGPDEEYYLRFGQAVASGVGADAAEFTFMDPGYGYLLGAIFKLLGVNLFAVYLLQALLDTVTAFGLLTIGRMLGRPRAGLIGALLYAVCATAIMFCATLLKEICVAAYLTGWVVSALAVYRSQRKLAWLAFGVFCGIGVALRSTLLLLVPLALLLPLLAGRSRSLAAAQGLLLCAGLALALAPWSIRNERAVGSLSPLPHNGGIVLHQAYNADNPQSAIWIPEFVAYSHPSEIWRGYAAAAEARAGHSLSPTEIDRYWRGEALRFMGAHPAAVIGVVVHKSLMFLADTEVPNNRSSIEERLFSPLLRVLPPPAAWLLAMGLAGLAWLAIQDRRWLIIAAPIAISWATMALFWAEDRFRFHCMPELALCSGVFIDELARHIRSYRRWQMPAFGALAVLVAAVSLYLGGRFPPPAVRWDHVVWGYIKMGKLEDARRLAERIAIEQPDNAPIVEARGYLAATAQDYREAVRDYDRAISLRPRSYLAHYNLARALLAFGDKSRAAEEARISMSLHPSADTAALLAQIVAAP
jgi:4-amino-4-deoxy-L-arabinose transferase-like glycosyltransferase